MLYIHIIYSKVIEIQYNGLLQSTLFFLHFCHVFLEQFHSWFTNSHKEKIGEKNILTEKYKSIYPCFIVSPVNQIQFVDK